MPRQREVVEMGCMIRIDPDELSSAASVLHGMAAGLADVGSAVQNACCSCCLPAGIEGQVLAQSSSIQSNLSSITEYFGVEATDLNNRGSLAANDSLSTAASSASGPGSSPPGMTYAGGGSDSVIIIPPADTAYFVPDVISYVGGNSDPEIFITVPGATATFTPDVISYVGGNSDPGMTITPPSAEEMAAITANAQRQTLNSVLNFGPSYASALSRLSFETPTLNFDPSLSSINSTNFFNGSPQWTPSHYTNAYGHSSPGLII